MDELPPDARAFLARAKGEHDPHDPEARARVERRLWAALALGGTGASVYTHPAPGAGTPALGSWLASNKAMLASVALMFVAGGAWLGLRQVAPQVAAPAAPVALAAPVVEALPAAPQVSALEPRASAHLQDSNGERAAAHMQNPAGEVSAGGTARLSRTDARAQRASVIATRSPAPSSLAEEAALLARASDQLTQRNAQAAAKLLDEHARRYPNSQLHEEREGFVVMTRCLHGAPEGADDARAFVSKNPASVLIPRLSHLCAL
jgi:hypothetical protein